MLASAREGGATPGVDPGTGWSVDPLHIKLRRPDRTSDQPSLHRTHPCCPHPIRPTPCRLGPCWAAICETSRQGSQVPVDRSLRGADRLWQWPLSGGQGRRSIAQRDPLAGPARAGRGRARAPGATGRRRRRNTLAQIPPSRTKPDQAGPRKWAWIFLDSFVQFEAFQWVTGNSNQKMQLPRWRPVGASRPASIRPIAAMGASESLGDERLPHGPPWRDPAGAPFPSAISIFSSLSGAISGFSAGSRRTADRGPQAAGLRSPRPARRHFRANCIGLSAADLASVARHPGGSVANVRDPSGERARSAAAETAPASRFPRPGWPRGALPD